MQIPNIFHYSDLVEYLDTLGAALSKRGHYSHAQWARKLKFRSPRTIGMVLAGKRAPSQALVERLAEAFALGAVERKYLFSLADLSRVPLEAVSERQRICEELSRLRPRFIQRKLLKAEQFKNIARWYNVVIKQLIECEDFDPNPENIAARLGNRVTVLQVQRSIERMLLLGIIRLTPEKKRFEVTGAITTECDVPAAAVKLHHAEQAQRGITALYEQDVLEREFRALTLRCDPSRINECKQFLRTMVDEFDRQFGSSKTSIVYQLNLHFFRQTEKRRQA